MKRNRREKAVGGKKGGLMPPSPQSACFGIPYTLGKRKAIRFLTSLSRMETLPVRLIRSAALWPQRLEQFQKCSISGGILLAAWLLCQVGVCQELPKAIELLPASTQAFAALPKSSEFIKNWKETQLGLLADDERMKDFWSNQQEELRRRLAAAGWQLSLKVEDLENLCSGQAALGLISRPEVTEKPFSLALIIDVADRAEALDKFFQRVGIDMESQKGVLNKVDASGVEVKHYSIPKLSADGRKGLLLCRLQRPTSDFRRHAIDPRAHRGPVESPRGFFVQV